MIKEVYNFKKEENLLRRGVECAEKEYFNYWMKEPHLDPSGLSKYIDLGGSGCATQPDTPHYRGIGESGWDNTPRFGEDITKILPVDLNCLLFQYEKDLSLFYTILDDSRKVEEWENRAKKRKELINKYCRNNNTGFFYDYDIEKNKIAEDLPKSLASFFPLWSGLADADQAKKLVSFLDLFETEFGLMTCESGWDNNTQWNYPVGWTPLHWIVIYGLRKYNFDNKALNLALKWIRFNASMFKKTGVLREKYNVVNPDERLPGRYGPQRGFGWTNVVFCATIVKILFGSEIDLISQKYLWKPLFPKEWENKPISINQISE